MFFRQAGEDELSAHQKGFKDIFSDKDAQFSLWNKEYIRANLQTHSSFFDDIDGKSLDEQQRIAVLTDEDNNLVLAGAGSGKTLTIAGKVKFLTQIKKVRPEEILLISFTNKAAGEMQERISKKLHVNVDVKTFHKLGNGIIAKHVNIKQSISDELRPYVQTFFDREILTRPALLQHIVQFFGVYFNIPRDRSEFETLGEYHESQRGLDFESLKSKLQRMNSTHQTLKGETMKSLEEIMIANFLFLNGVEYEYEKNMSMTLQRKSFDNINLIFI
ncbi:UvrD-helicase domain-containing protein [Paenibacillus sp. OVF10]|nr:UvrD-helicase domain-containing protein [Paenibacillus sp. OVF10]